MGCRKPEGARELQLWRTWATVSRAARCSHVKVIVCVFLAAKKKKEGANMRQRGGGGKCE
jgi:hypothetical protein